MQVCFCMMNVMNKVYYQQKCSLEYFRRIVQIHDNPITNQVSNPTVEFLNPKCRTAVPNPGGVTIFRRVRRI